MEDMLIYRLEDLSVNHFVKEQFAADAFITVVNKFPRTEIAKRLLTLPTISVISGRLKEEMFELGNRDAGVRTRRWFIDIFANSGSQVDDFAYRLLDVTDNGISVYNYNEGFPPDASPTKINHLSVISKTYEPINIISTDLNEILYHRGQLILITINDKV